MSPPKGDCLLAGLRSRFGGRPLDACGDALFAAPHCWIHPEAKVVDGGLFELPVADDGALTAELARAALFAAKLQRLAKELFALEVSTDLVSTHFTDHACDLVVHCRSTLAPALVALHLSARRGYPAYETNRMRRPDDHALLTLHVVPHLGVAHAPRLADAARDALKARGLALPADDEDRGLNCQHTPGSLLAVCACVQEAISGARAHDHAHAGPPLLLPPPAAEIGA